MWSGDGLHGHAPFPTLGPVKCVVTLVENSATIKSMAESTKGTWLVKSGGRILGPYDQSQIGELLKSKEITPLDEVSDPGRRWRYIRDHSIFASYIEDLRASLGDKTSATSTTSLTDGITHRLSEDSQWDNLTDEVSNFSGSMKEIVYEDVASYDDLPKQETKARYQTVGVSEQVAGTAYKWRQKLWLVVGGVVLIAGLFVYYERFIHEPIQKEAQAKDYLQEGLRFLQEGDYVMALDTLRRAGISDARTNLLLGVLLIQVEGQTLLGKRLLDQVLSNPQGDQVRANTGLGIASLIESELEMAEAFFKKALEIDPLFLPPLVNLGVIAEQRGDRVSAQDYFRAAVDKGIEDGAVYLMLAKSYFDSWKENQNRASLAEGRQTLLDYLITAQDYLQESALLLSYAYFLDGEKAQAERWVIEALDQDPHLTVDHRHNLFIYRKIVEWPNLLSLCQSLSAGLGDDPRMQSIEALCLIQAGHSVEARRVMERGVHRSPRDPLLQAFYSFVLTEGGLDTPASVALGRAREYDRRREYFLPTMLQARFCQLSGDYQCAIRSWQQALEKNKGVLSARSGLAWSQFYQENYFEASRYLVEGIQISNSYKPLLQLKNRMQEQGLLTDGQAGL